MYGKYSTSVCREANTAQGEGIFRTHKQGGTLSVILYFLVVWFGAIFSSTQTAAIVGDQDISKCLTNLFLVME